MRELESGLWAGLRDGESFDILTEVGTKEEVCTVWLPGLSMGMGRADSDCAVLGFDRGAGFTVS